MALPQAEGQMVKVSGKLPADPALFSKYLDSRKNAIKGVAASFMSPERLVKIILRCVAMNPGLQKCTMESVFRSALMAAELGLEPGSALGEAYFVPYKNTCQMIPGYRGLVTLARRSGEVEDIYAFAVFKGDDFDVQLGTDARIQHTPKFGSREPADLEYVYCVAKLKGGAVHFDVMTRVEVDKIRGRSAAGGSGPWVSDYVEMAKKTVVRRACKMLPMSVEMAKATSLENAHDTGDYTQMADFECIDGEVVPEIENPPTEAPEPMGKVADVRARLEAQAAAKGSGTTETEVAACAECNAPAGKPHGSKCSKGAPVAAPAEPQPALAMDDDGFEAPEFPE